MVPVTQPRREAHSRNKQDALHFRLQTYTLRVVLRKQSVNGLCSFWNISIESFAQMIYT